MVFQFLPEFERMSPSLFGSSTNAAGSVTASTTVTLVPPVISAFSASPSSLILGGSTTLSWNVAGAASLSISGIGAVSGTSVVVTPSATSLYTLTATNASGSVTASVTVTVNNPPPPTITSFGASATPINLGSSSTLSWSVSGATSLSIDQGIGSVSGGSIGVTPTVTTTYTLTASNAWGTATRSVMVTVLPPTISSFTASPSGITLGQGSTLAWSTAYATSVSISGVGAVAASGSTGVSPTTTTTYTLTATSSAGTTTAQVTVALAAPVINSLSATYTQITLGSGTTLVWNVTGAESLSLTPGPGTVTGPSATVFPTATTVYTLTASNAAGSVTRNITITVDGAPLLLWTKSLIYGFGQLLCEEHASGPALIYVQSDQVGSPNWVTDANGALLNYTKNLPFGERLADANPNAPKSLRRFTNHEEDTDSNAIYMQAREYLAGYGKFAQPDPAYDQTKLDPESWNLFGYVTNNPVTHTDPDGRMQARWDPAQGPPQSSAIDYQHIDDSMGWTGWNLESVALMLLGKPSGMLLEYATKTDTPMAAFEAENWARIAWERFKEKRKDKVAPNNIIISSSADIFQIDHYIPYAIFLGIYNGGITDGNQASEDFRKAHSWYDGEIVVVLNPHGVVKGGVDKALSATSPEGTGLVQVVAQRLLDFAGKLSPLTFIAHSDGTQLLDRALGNLGSILVEYSNLKIFYFGSPQLWSAADHNVTWIVRSGDPVTWLGSFWRIGAAERISGWGHSFSGYMQDAGDRIP